MTDITPLRSLRLRTPRLELRLGDRSELEELASVASGGIHPPHEMPFAVPWTDAVGDPRFVEDFVGFHERALTEWTPASWALNLLVFADGHPVGTQSVGAEGFAVARTVHTGSWLGSESQGRGLGTEMRAAVLELAFTGLGARAARWQRTCAGTYQQSPRFCGMDAQREWWPGRASGHVVWAVFHRAAP